jgi:transcriptional regulator with XRE-family HTH domain
MEDLGKIYIVNLKRFRKEKGITQEKLSELIDVSSSYIGRIETGGISPSFKIIQSISEKLDIAPYLFFIPEKASNVIEDVKAKEILANLKEILRKFE